MRKIQGFGNVKQEQIKMIRAPRSEDEVLGTLAKFPQLLLNPRMELTEDCFVHKLHKIIFNAIKDIVCKDNSVKRLTYKDIDDYLSAFDELYKIWNKYNGLHHMEFSIEHCNPNTFKIHYRELLKHAMLRKFGEAGIDVMKIYNFLEVDLEKLTENREQFETMNRGELEKQLIDLGKGDVQLIEQLSNTEAEIDSQIELLMKQKKNVAELKKNLGKQLS